MKKSRHKLRLKNYFLAVILIWTAVAISGCINLTPSETPVPSLSPSPIPTITPTIDWFPSTPTATIKPDVSPTPRPTIESQRDGIADLVINDNFSDESLWQTFESTSGNAAYGINTLTLAVAQQNASLTSVSQHNLPENFYLEFTFQISLCQPQDEIGILFLYTGDGDFYRLLMTCGGQYRLELIQGDQSAVIQDWERASEMNFTMPASNRLGIWVNQGRFQFYLNDVFQFEQSIIRDRSGGLGFFARTIEGTAMTIRFSDLQVYQVDLQE